MSVLVKILNKIPRKMDVKTLAFIIIIVVVLIEILFMWLFVKKQTPVLGISPISVKDQLNHSYLFSLGYQTNNPEAALDAPMDVAVDKSGRTFVADTGHNAIKVYNSYGQYQYQFGGPGDEPGQLSGPTGIAILNDVALVTETGNRRISVFDLKGKFLGFFIKEKEIPQLQGIIPCGISISPQGMVFVTDIFQQRVICFTPDGFVLFYFGKPGNKPGYFAYPNDVAVDAQENIYVADSNNARVQVFNNQGKFISELQDKDPTKKLSLPRGIAIYQDQVFVVDTFNHTVRIMSKEKGQIAQFGQYGAANGQLNYPNGIALAESKVFVVDRANDRIAVFAY